MEQVNINIVPNGIKPICHVSQYDKGRQIRLNLYDGDNRYTLSGTETLELDVKKADGTVYTNEITNTEDNYLIISTAEEMTSAYGENFCNIKITDDTVVIGSLNFILDVEKSPLDDGVTSSSFIYDLRQQIIDILNNLGTGLYKIEFDIELCDYTVVE